MYYRERQRIVKNQGTSLTRRRLAPMISCASMISLALACVVGVTGCATDPSSSEVERHPENFRCRFTQLDGTCNSMPINCPVTLPPGVRGTAPNCPAPGEIIPIEEDHCAHKFICTD
jgi:hypothetical protein